MIRPLVHGKLLLERVHPARLIRFFSRCSASFRSRLSSLFAQYLPFGDVACDAAENAFRDKPWNLLRELGFRLGQPLKGFSDLCIRDTIGLTSRLLHPGSRAH